VKELEKLGSAKSLAEPKLFLYYHPLILLRFSALKLFDSKKRVGRQAALLFF
jgi:hypothetical protein